MLGSSRNSSYDIDINFIGGWLCPLHFLYSTFGSFRFLGIKPNEQFFFFYYQIKLTFDYLLLKQRLILSIKTLSYYRQYVSI